MRVVYVTCAALLFCMFSVPVLADEPSRAAPVELTREGWLLLEQKKPAEALNIFKAALNADPDLVDAHRGYQDAMLATGKKYTALDEYRKRVKDNPDSAAACYLLSRLLDDAGEERRWLEKALKKDEKCAWAHYGMARLMLADNDVEAAETSLKRAMELQPGMAHAYKALALLYIGKAETAEAEKCYLQAVEKLPKEPFPHFGLAEIYLSEEKYKEALKHIDAAIELRKDVPDYFIRKAEILHDLGRREEALEALRTVLQMNPTREDSIDAYKVSEKIATPDWDFNKVDWELYKIAVSKLNAGSVSEALKRFSELLNRKGGVALLHYQIGRAYQKKKDIKKAAAFFEEAMKLEPDYAQPFYLMARIHYDLGVAEKDKEKAEGYMALSEKMALHAVSRHPFYPFSYRLLGEIHHRRGEYEKVLQYAVYFYKIRHNYPEIRYLFIDEVRIADDKEKPLAEFKIETFNVKVYPGLFPLGRKYITHRLHVYKDGKIHKYLFAEIHASRDEDTGKITEAYYLCEILDGNNRTHDGFLGDKEPPSVTDYELAIREVLALEALND